MILNQATSDTPYAFAMVLLPVLQQDQAQVLLKGVLLFQLARNLTEILSHRPAATTIYLRMFARPPKLFTTSAQQSMRTHGGCVHIAFQG